VPAGQQQDKPLTQIFRVTSPWRLNALLFLTPAGLPLENMAKRRLATEQLIQRQSTRLQSQPAMPAPDTVISERHRDQNTGDQSTSTAAMQAELKTLYAQLEAKLKERQLEGKKEDIPQKTHRPTQYRHPSSSDWRH